STLKSPSYTKSVSWQHYLLLDVYRDYCRMHSVYYWNYFR
ncbi:transposase, partial [Shigella flexneri]